jgi:hypothetical protein
VGPRAGLDDVEKRKFLTLPGLELRLLCRPVRSQSLYRLRYPGSFLNKVLKRKILIHFLESELWRALCKPLYLEISWRLIMQLCNPDLPVLQ